MSVSQLASAETAVQSIALFDGKAMLSINGKKAKIINEGETYEGVRLINSNTEKAEVEFDGKRETIYLNGTVILLDSLGTKVEPKESTQIWADASGFFRSVGAINGEPLDFLVDTGANLVVLSSDQADIGLRVNFEYEFY